MDESRIQDVLRRFVTGELDRDQAVRELLPTAGSLSRISFGGSRDQELEARLQDLVKALDWESLRRAAPLTVPDVAYGSPEYHSFVASNPGIVRPAKFLGGPA